jgi:hypothetical protein
MPSKMSAVFNSKVQNSSSKILQVKPINEIEVESEKIVSNEEPSFSKYCQATR